MVIDTIWYFPPYIGYSMKAEMLFHQRVDYDDGAIVEMVIWRVPLPVPPSTHGLKYSLFYAVPADGWLVTTTSAAKAITGTFRERRQPTGSRRSNS
jgi:hypothetical protein